MSLRDEKQTLKQEARPAGTRFAAITLVVLLVLVGIYFVGAHGREVSESPVLGNSAQSKSE